jgi:hypothetical protein
VPPDGVNVIAPWYTPAASPAPFTDTFRVAGAVPLDGVTDSQLAPEVVEATAVKLGDPPALETARDWAAGFDPPVVKENESDAGLADRPAAADIFLIRPELDT